MHSDYELDCGSVPLLISLPHDGTEIPPEVATQLVAEAQAVPDTDWHVGKLYAPLASALGASLIRPRWSRYVVDLNRPASGQPLYPGRQETALLPLTAFDGSSLYRPGCEPDLDEQKRRVQRYWQPYHQALAAELQRLRDRHPRVLLWEGHSIRSHCPMFFSGRLTDFNLGSADGASADDALLQRLLGVLQRHRQFSYVGNGRFKGGYITRHYGRPAEGISAIQLELTQSSYMDEEPPFPWDAERAAAARLVVGQLLTDALEWIEDGDAN